MSDPAALPSSARVVVIGGGVGGASVAYHLAQAGERDVVLLERADLTSGSTFHSAGLVGVLRADPTLTRMNMHSAALYAELQGGDHPPGWVPSGGLKLASSPERLEEIRRQVSWARTYGLGLEEISVAEAVDLFPLIDPTGVVGAAWLPEDGWVDPSSLCLSLIAGARAGGVTVRTRTRVVGIDTVTLQGGRSGRALGQPAESSQPGDPLVDAKAVGPDRPGSARRVAPRRRATPAEPAPAARRNTDARRCRRRRPPRSSADGASASIQPMAGCSTVSLRQNSTETSEPHGSFATRYVRLTAPAQSAMACGG